MLVAGAAAGSLDIPDSDTSAVVILTAGKALSPATKSYLDSHKATSDLYAIGGDGADATAGYAPAELVGQSRYEAAAFVAELFFGGQSYAGIATGVNWPDALAAGRC